MLTQAGREALLLRNDLDIGHHWLRLRLAAKPPNVDAVGARVELEAGGETQYRQVMPARSYLSQVELAVTFGLGRQSAVDAVTITWPDGTSETLVSPPVDRVLVVSQQ